MELQKRCEIITLLLYRARQSQMFYPFNAIPATLEDILSQTKHRSYLARHKIIAETVNLELRRLIATYTLRQPNIIMQTLHAIDDIKKVRLTQAPQMQNMLKFKLLPTDSQSPFIIGSHSTLLIPSPLLLLGPTQSLIFFHCPTFPSSYNAWFYACIR